jgi:NADPH2:quinone reductase
MQDDDVEATMTSSTSVSVPETMKAELIDRFGPPEEVMHAATIRVPEVGDGEILIEVHTAGIGAWDPEICKGELGAEGGLPRVLGSDGSGTVVAAGPNAHRFELGDRVYAYGFMNPKGGFYAEYAAVPEDEVSEVPATLSLDEAGTLACDGLTALAGLDVVQLGRDQTLMVYGASGGVGHLAVELAKRIGARVLAIASGSDGVELARRLGADEAVDGHRSDIATTARTLAPSGVDAALVLAGRAPEDLLGLVKQGGRIGYPHGVEPAPRGRAGIAVQPYDGYHGRDAFERLNRFIAVGPFHVAVSRTYALEEVPKALADVTRHHLGKLAVRVHGPT